tara:strand:+ start:26329 stop:26637 length:309 start_codon:yes stop_codon:yes gene_type:complete
MAEEKSEYDLDKDGYVRTNEVDMIKEIKELEMAERKQSSQRRMAIVALASMILFTILCLTPIISDERLEMLSGISDLFYIAMAGVVGTYMGMSAYMDRGRGS